MAGAIFERTGLVDWDVAALASILRLTARNCNSSGDRKRWFSKLPVEVRIDGTAPLCLAFDGPIGTDPSRDLRILGLRFDRKDKIWLGTVDPGDISVLTDSGRYRQNANGDTDSSGAWVDIRVLYPAMKNRPSKARDASSENGLWVPRQMRQRLSQALQTRDCKNRIWRNHEEVGGAFLKKSVGYFFRSGKTRRGQMPLGRRVGGFLPVLTAVRQTHVSGLPRGIP